jgi:hypothetical protein
MAILFWVLANGIAVVLAQEGSPSLPPIADSPRSVAPSSDTQQELLDRLRKMEERADRVMKLNEDLSRENRALAEQVRGLSHQFSNSGLQGTMPGAIDGTA